MAKRCKKARFVPSSALLFDSEMDGPRCKVRETAGLKRQALAAILGAEFRPDGAVKLAGFFRRFL